MSLDYYVRVDDFLKNWIRFLHVPMFGLFSWFIWTQVYTTLYIGYFANRYVMHNPPVTVSTALCVCVCCVSLCQSAFEVVEP